MKPALSVPDFFDETMPTMNKKTACALSCLALALMASPAVQAAEIKTAPKASAKTAMKGAKPAQTGKTTPPAASAQGEPLVTWRDQAIYPLDFEASLQIAPKADQEAFRRDMRRISAMLENVLVQRTLAAEAVQAGLDQDPLFAAEVQIARERILARMRIQAFEAGLKVPDLTATAEERYKLKPEAYFLPEVVQASHVLVSTEKRSEAEARARAEEVLARARAGEEFGKLAREYSDDPTVGTNNGDLGFFGRGKMVPAFEQAAFALEKPGDLSEVVQSQFGFHVIRLQRKRPASQQTFEEVKAQLIDELQKKWISDQKAAYIADIKNDKTIKLNEDGINALQIK